MAQTGAYHGGLIFSGEQSGELNRFCKIVTATLEDYGHSIERQSMSGAHQARIVTSQYLVKLSLDEKSISTPLTAVQAVPPQNRLQIELIPVAEGFEDRDISELMIVVMLYRMVDICTTELIEWMDPGTVLTVDQFLSAFSNVSPHRVHGRNTVLNGNGARFAPVEDTAPQLAQRFDAISELAREDDERIMVRLTDDEQLALAFRTEAAQDSAGASSKLSSPKRAQNDIHRLTSWGLTGMVAFLSLPVAAAMAAVNLARGEDFRLNTQVLSLTGLLVVLQSSGALASVIARLPI